MLGLLRWNEPGAPLMIAGGVLYVVGMFVVTMVFNVPLNNALMAVDPASPEGTGAMDALSSRLDWWNHVRTITSTLAFALFIGAIAVR